MLKRLDRPEGHRRLARLSDELRTGWHPHFHMGCWGTCAASVACRLPEFQAVGLRGAGIEPRFGGAQGHWAMAEFFGISLVEARSIFSSTLPDPKSPAAAADRIDQVLRKRAMIE